jgi:hypothetical protein
VTNDVAHAVTTLTQGTTRKGRNSYCSEMEGVYRHHMDPFDPKREYIERNMTNTPLGTGAFGKTVLGHDSDHPKKFIIKKIKLTRSDRAALAELRSCVEQDMAVCPPFCVYPLLL